MPHMLLLMAHPGHELMLHHWMERQRPTVFALSDGSGSLGVARTERSRRVIEASGATTGAIFGLLPDAAWYRAIVAQDVAPFMRVIEAMTDHGSVTPSAVVSDSIEYFNPLHDLCCVVGHAVTHRINARGGRAQHLDYPIEAKSDRALGEQLTLDGPALARKHAAISNYEELQREIERRSAGMNLGDLGHETLHAARCLEMWPQHLGFEPLYEKYGRARVGSGVYRDVITYADHVRPLVMRLLGRS
jgi:hypothetical protein